MIASGMEDESERADGEFVALGKYRGVDGLAIDIAVWGRAITTSLKIGQSCPSEADPQKPHRPGSATPTRRVLHYLRNGCSITPERPLHDLRNECSIWIGTGAPLRPEGAVGRP
jgi:hypothetical protein